jgi:PIN domain nuclease of toxin-antitoxin system
MEVLPVSLEHALRAGSLEGAHRDPFDRILIAQSRVEELPIVTRDPVFRDYGVDVIW